MRRFYAPKENFSGGKIALSPEETRHLRDVLRLRAGEIVRVFDGEGREFSCAIERIEKRETVLTILKEASPSAPVSNLNLTLAVALLKGEKFDLIVQKAVELGVTRLVPVMTKRIDVKIRDSEKRVERWQKIALEAAKQSGRADLMKIEPPIEFANFIKNSASERSGGENLLLFSERGGESFSAINAGEKIIAVVGSEGGWEDSEIEAAKSAGFQIVTMKGRILRAETAAIAVAAVLQHRFGDFN
ncbi:MAG TPA: 16S rRNA (uracil(1498)-N(3))-methyltransferase [Pyrinomonadaceae bacterium]|jgi:16S rRNA (uracil1498-N3)-methyltransferase